jgi:tetratricopeptide (TPR) repeat protein
MLASSVLRMQEYKDRRSARLRLGRALHSGDTRRRAVFDHLMEVCELAGADRAAAVWVDEHGSGLVHPYVVVDQLGGRTRRVFASGPLREAWQLGVPSAFEAAAVPSTGTPATFAVALGSDGARAWFVVADSLVPRGPLAREVRHRLMFLAGECAAIVLHRDLDVVIDPEGSIAGSRFAGWDILADLEGRESDEVESRRIAQRFVVARLVRLLVDDDLTVARERTVEQVKRARAEIANGDGAGPESDLWLRTLAALEEERFEDLAATLVDLGDLIEAQGHVSGAREIYQCALSVAAGIGAPRPAANAARLMGRLVRRQADWDEARRWFGVARDISEAAGTYDIGAQVLVGLAGISKETGNLPVARRTFVDALALAERSRDRDTVALVHHALLGLEHSAGNFAVGIQHGWVAVAMYQNEAPRLRCLASLAGALMDYGDLDAAEDAWTVVASSCDEQYYRLFAHAALAQIAARWGDREGFAGHAARCDSLNWQAGPASAAAQILYSRGLGYRDLGDDTLARDWMERALSFAEQHGYNQIVFEAEGVLAALSSMEGTKATAEPLPAAPREVREGLRAMRRGLALSGV